MTPDYGMELAQKYRIIRTDAGGLSGQEHGVVGRAATGQRPWKPFANDPIIALLHATIDHELKLSPTTRAARSLPTQGKVKDLVV
jgi:hypothetical protein